MASGFVYLVLIFASDSDFHNVEDDKNENGAGSDLNSENRLDQIISDYRKIQECASKEIDRKRRVVRSKCEERLWMAALWRDYQLDIVKKSFDNEIKQIEREHQVKRIICVIQFICRFHFLVRV